MIDNKKRIVDFAVPDWPHSKTERKRKEFIFMERNYQKLFKSSYLLNDSLSLSIYIYIYIYRERERVIQWIRRYTYIYIYILHLKGIVSRTIPLRVWLQPNSLIWVAQFHREYNWLEFKIFLLFEKLPYQN